MIASRPSTVSASFLAASIATGEARSVRPEQDQADQQKAAVRGEAKQPELEPRRAHGPSIASRPSSRSRSSGSKTPIRTASSPVEERRPVGRAPDRRATSGSRTARSPTRSSRAYDRVVSSQRAGLRCQRAPRRRDEAPRAGAEGARARPADDRARPTSAAHRRRTKRSSSNVIEAASIIERIYAKQHGVDGMIDKIPDRRHGEPDVVLPQPRPVVRGAQDREGRRLQRARPSSPKKISGLYPASVQKDDPKFCETLAKRKDADAAHPPVLRGVARRGRRAEGRAVHTRRTRPRWRRSRRSSKPPRTRSQSTEEAAFKAYLTAAAQAFLDQRLGAGRRGVGEDERRTTRSGTCASLPTRSYCEPCSRKAGFHVSFARINQDSLDVAEEARPGEERDGEGARQAGRHAVQGAQGRRSTCPDFIDIVLNAGDSRNAARRDHRPEPARTGARSPNEGRGRTVAMTNLYTDADSSAAARGRRPRRCSARRRSTKRLDATRRPLLMSHGAARGRAQPRPGARVQGRTARPTTRSSAARSPRCWRSSRRRPRRSSSPTGWSRRAAHRPERGRRTSHVRDVVWAFGHISRGHVHGRRQAEAVQPARRDPAGHC